MEQNNHKRNVTQTHITTKTKHCRLTLYQSLRNNTTKPNNRHKKQRQKLRKSLQKTKTDDSNIVNFTEHILTPTQTTVLNKGLKYVPTPKPHTLTDIKQSFNSYKRTMLLKYHYRNEPLHRPHPFHTKSTWTPNLPNYKPLLEYFDKTFTSLTKTNITDHIKDNMTNSEKRALKELQQLPDTIIKPADKGGSIVLLPTKMYMDECYRQLQDTKFYKPTHNNINPIPHLNTEISNYITALHKQKLIDSTTKQYLLPKTPSRTPLFYILPKIHKEGIPGRPIISGCDSPTDRLSSFVDYYLKPLIPNIPSYIKDTTDFLNKILHLPPLPSNAKLVTIDVKSLYTNIPQDEGIHTALNMFDKYPDPSRPNNNILERMMTYILKYNYFQFNDTNYLQIHGTAMGTKFAPSFANTFMAHIEQQIYDNAPDKLLPYIWLRFLDDVFLIWTHDDDSLYRFLDYINTVHPTIKFTHTISEQTIDFLDTTIYILENRQLASTLYKKPTDKSQLLHYYSQHPLSTKLGVIYSQALRYRRIITEDQKFEEQLLQLKLLLIKRKYPIQQITTAFNKARQFTQQQLLLNDYSKTSKTKQNILPFIIQYNTSLPRLNQILRQHWHYISEDPLLNRLFPEQLTVAYSRHNNLKDLLVHTKLK